MILDDKFWIAKSEENLCLSPKMANRHGLIAGATGTGKTITLKVFAESFSRMGVPVFLADIKGDVSGMAEAGLDSASMQKRLVQFGLLEHGFKYQGYPVHFWDIYQKKGHPVRVTVSEMGPLLLARVLELNETQESVLETVFRVADNQGMLLLDLKDLKSMIKYVGENASELASEYGSIPTQSIGSITRQVLSLEDAGGSIFFGEPALDLNDWMKNDKDGKGFINILHCAELFQSPKLYSTFLLWLLSELYELLPEVGDMDKPKMVFFFDEAHLLFQDAQKSLLTKIEQVVRLIRSKGVGIYFVTQSPTDIPDSVLSQLGNRVQHALRAYSPSEQKAVKVAAQTFRANPKFKTEDVIVDLGIGEALVSFLDEEGRPSIVERASILPPECSMGALNDDARNKMILASEFHDKYAQEIDRESAYEKLNKKVEVIANNVQNLDSDEEDKKVAKEKALEQKQHEKAIKERDKLIGKVASTAMNTFSREVTKSLSRGLMGLFKR